MADSEPDNSDFRPNPDGILDLEFLSSFESLRLLEDSDGSISTSNTHSLSQFQTININGGDQDSKKIMKQYLTFQNTIRPFFEPHNNGNIWAFDISMINRGGSLLSQSPHIGNTPISDFRHGTEYLSAGSSYSTSSCFGPVGFNKYDAVVNDSRNRSKIEKLLSGVRSSVSWLMVDEHVLFQSLVDACESEADLNLLATNVFSDIPPFINAAFTTYGIKSILKLIPKFKKTNHAFTLTQTLATRFYEMATHPIAKLAILKSLIVLGSGPNEILYERVIRCHRHLAIHKVGCLTLNTSIDTIFGDQRTILLDYIAEFSDYLSNDPYGNFVVQHVLEQGDRKVNDKILLRLRGQFVRLAQKQRGSHVVEKCMKSSENGLMRVVKEILQSDKWACVLAGDQFGNYVIQNALDMTKKLGRIELYDSLVEALNPLLLKLNPTAVEKHVVNFLKRESLSESVDQWLEMTIPSDYQDDH